MRSRNLWEEVAVVALSMIAGAVVAAALPETAAACLFDDPALCTPGNPTPPPPPPSTEEPDLSLLDAEDAVLMAEPVAEAPHEAVCGSGDDPEPTGAEGIETLVRDEGADEDSAEAEVSAEELAALAGFEGCAEVTPRAATCVFVTWGFTVRKGFPTYHRLYDFTMRKHFCYDGRRVYEVFGTEWTSNRLSFAGVTILERSHGHDGQYVTWRVPRGANWSLHWAFLEGCALKWGCIKSYTPRATMVNRADGKTEVEILQRK